MSTPINAEASEEEGGALTRRKGALGALAVALLVALPGIFLRVTGTHPAPPLAAFLYALAIISAAFVLSWAAEAAQVDVSAGLAIAVLALIAVLPEYAVDFVFAWKGGDAYEQFGRQCRSPEQLQQGVESACSLALANMTGANRILIGIGWALVVLVAVLALRKRAGQEDAVVRLEPTKSVDLAFLAVATIYSLTLPLRSTLSLIDSVVLVGIFVAYAYRISKAPASEPDLVGPAAWVGGLDKKPRRATTVALFVVSAAIILVAAEPFAEALVDTGVELGISEFFLVQWLAPLASESPELIVAVLFAWRLKTSDSLGTLLSSKVNQWTLLVGTLPIVFAISATGWDGLPIDDRQREELLLTAAQSAFAVSLLVGLSIGVKGAVALFTLFAAQFALAAFLPESLAGAERVGLSVVYLVLAAIILVRKRQLLMGLLRDGFRTPYAELDDPETEHPSVSGGRH